MQGRLENLNIQTPEHSMKVNSMGRYVFTHATMELDSNVSIPLLFQKAKLHVDILN